MQARMKNPAMILPDAMQALQALHAAAEKGGVPKKTIGLVEVRASQINGCSVCVDMHARLLKKTGETDEGFSQLQPGGTRPTSRTPNAPLWP
jgi:AhpD family alkylhydroperoxidase